MPFLKEKTEFMAVSLWQPVEKGNWEEEIKKDEKLSEIMQLICTSQSAPLGYTIKKGLLLYHGRVVIPLGCQS